MFVVFKQKTAYEMRISDWSSDVCSSDLVEAKDIHAARGKVSGDTNVPPERPHPMRQARIETHQRHGRHPGRCRGEDSVAEPWNVDHFIHWPRSEEHTSELQSLMRISYAVFCLKKKK